MVTREVVWPDAPRLLACYVSSAKFNHSHTSSRAVRKSNYSHTYAKHGVGAVAANEQSNVPRGILLFHVLPPPAGDTAIPGCEFRSSGNLRSRDSPLVHPERSRGALATARNSFCCVSYANPRGYPPRAFFSALFETRITAHRTRVLSLATRLPRVFSRGHSPLVTASVILWGGRFHYPERSPRGGRAFLLSRALPSRGFGRAANSTRKAFLP